MATGKCRPGVFRVDRHGSIRFGMSFMMETYNN